MCNSILYYCITFCLPNFAKVFLTIPSERQFWSTQIKLNQQDKSRFICCPEMCLYVFRHMHFFRVLEWDDTQMLSNVNLNICNFSFYFTRSVSWKFGYDALFCDGWVQPHHYHESAWRPVCCELQGCFLCVLTLLNLIVLVFEGWHFWYFLVGATFVDVCCISSHPVRNTLPVCLMKLLTWLKLSTLAVSSATFNQFLLLG